MNGSRRHRSNLTGQHFQRSLNDVGLTSRHLNDDRFDEGPQVVDSAMDTWRAMPQEYTKSLDCSKSPATAWSPQ